MATLRIDKDTFTNERDVVKEERRMRVDNQPYGRLNEIIYDQAFTVAPVQAPDDRQHGGSRGGVDRRRARLLPDLLRAGERDAGARRRLRLGAGAAAGRRSISAACRRPTARCRATSRRSRRRRKEKRVTLQEPWPLPAVVVAYHITYDGNPDSYPLHIASKVLSDGQSSRIYKKLVYEKQMAVAAFGSANLIEDPNLFYAVAIVQPGHTPEEVADALIAELDRLKAEPITEHELQRAKNQFARDYILGPRVEPAEGRPAGARRRHPQRHQDRRRRVRHLPEHHGRRRPARRADVLHAGEPAGADADAVGQGGRCGSDRRRRRCTERSALHRRCVLCALAALPALRRARSRRLADRAPPRPLPARDIKFPPYEIQTLPNGLQVVAVLHHEQPAVSMRLLVRAGTASDPKEKLGLAHLAASLLDQGTTTQVGGGDERRDRLHRRRDGRRRRRPTSPSSTWS